MKKFIPILVVLVLVLSGLGAAALNVEKESNTKSIVTENLGGPKDYTHTVLVEAGMRTGCPACPATNAAWKSIYASGNYDFEYVGLIYEYNAKAQQRFYSFNPKYVPTSYFDGGQYVCVGTNYNTFYNYLNSAGARTVPDLDATISATWLGNAKIEIGLSIENNDNNDYPGTLRVYVVELVSPRWNDHNGQPYGHALLDFPWQQSIDIDSGDTFEDSKVWDGAAAGYADIDPDNIQVILTVCDDEYHQSYSDPPSGNPFNAYYVDETVATLVIVNNPPAEPTIDGLTTGEAGVEYTYSFVTTDPEDEEVYYYVDWDDGNTQGWLGPYASGEEIFVNHTFSENGSYGIIAKAKDANDLESAWSNPFNVIIGNLAPETPEISGPPSGKVRTEYEYTFVATDKNNDQLCYWIEWGDETNSGWLGPYASEETASAKHKWTTKGTYEIKVKAKDTHGAESDWGTLEVTMPRNRAVYINHLFLTYLEQHPHIFPILRHLLGL